MSTADRASWSLNNPDYTGWNFTESVMYRANLVWDTSLLQWVKMSSAGGGDITIQGPFYTVLSDSSSTAGYTYYGSAVPGSASSASVWSIKKVSNTGDVTVTWASGTAAFNKIWNSRTGYSYS